MKSLKFKFDLDCKVAIYVPSTTNIDEVDDNNLQEILVKKTLATFSKLFGGATATDALGGWLATGENLVIERVTIVYAYCTKELFTSNIDTILSICEEIKNEMNQEAVTLEYNGQVKFI